MSDIETFTICFIVFVVLFSILHFSTIYYLCKKPDISKKKSANLQTLRDKFENLNKKFKEFCPNCWNKLHSKNSAELTNELKAFKSEVGKFSGDLEILSSWRSSHSGNSAKLTNKVKALKTQLEN